MPFAELSERFDKELETIKETPSNILEQSTMAIKLCREFLQLLKAKVLKDGFETNNEEVKFFKHIKQSPLSSLIYYSEIRSFEMQFPKADIDCQRKHIKKKIHKINKFFLYNMDFEQYIGSNFTHLDTQYFTRDFLEEYHFSSSKFYFQESDFSTSRDMLLGQIKAFALLINYLSNRLAQTNGNHSQLSINSKLRWTASKCDLTELVYALHRTRAINNGNVEIKDIAQSLQHAFNFDLPDFYKVYSEIKSRKKSRSKFLDELSTNFLSQIDSSEK